MQFCLNEYLKIAYIETIGKTEIETLIERFGST